MFHSSSSRWPAFLAAFCLVSGLFAFAARAAEGGKLRVATLHPLLGDLSREVGGKFVDVVVVLPPGGDPHDFQPTSQQMKVALDCQLLLASGKGIETYLGKLRDNLPASLKVVDVGEKIPSLRTDNEKVFAQIEGEEAGGHEDHDHDHGLIDPHWWHSTENLRRAAGILAAVFSEADPAHAAEYQAQGKAYEEKIRELKSWANKEMAKVPRAQRKVVTSHEAFGYLCEEFDMKSVAIEGLTAEHEANSKHLANCINLIKKLQIRAIFPEDKKSSKQLDLIVKETSVKLGEPLIADGNGTGEQATAIGMMKYNISAIIDALTK